MKKLIILFFLMTILALTGYYLAGDKTAVDALASYSTAANLELLHEEALGEETLLFYRREEGLGTAVAKKTFNGYKIVYSGYQGDLITTIERLGMSDMYFPSVEGTKPLFFGVIAKHGVDHLTVVSRETHDKVTARLIEKKDYAFWIADMTGFTGSRFAINAYTESGKQVLSQERNISPWRVEQKTFPKLY